MEKTLPKRFHFISLLTEIHHNVRVFCGLVGGGSLPKEMQRYWLHFTFQTRLLGKFSLDECSGKVSVHMHEPLCTPLQSSWEKALKWIQNAAFFAPSVLQSWRLKSQFCTWIESSFALVCIHVRALQLSALWDTSVMESVSPIVGVLDGVADNILPSGHLRSVITLHLPQPALLQGMSMHRRTGFGENAWFDDNLLAFFLSVTALLTWEIL